MGYCLLVVNVVILTYEIMVVAIEILNFIDIYLHFPVSMPVIILRIDFVLYNS